MEEASVSISTPRREQRRAMKPKYLKHMFPKDDIYITKQNGNRNA